MIIGIQVTETKNKALLNSFWLLNEARSELRCICAKSRYKEDQVVAINDLGWFENIAKYR